MSTENEPRVAPTGFDRLMAVVDRVAPFGMLRSDLLAAIRQYGDSAWNAGRAETLARQVAAPEPLREAVLARHDWLRERHGESCDCELCLQVQIFADLALRAAAQGPEQAREDAHLRGDHELWPGEGD